MEHTAQVQWTLSGSEFVKGKYSREHTWAFDGGLVVPASPSPHVVRPPYSNPANLDPEEALVAAIASCHMLAFLHLASRRGLEVLSYRDDAVGTMTKNERRVPWVSRVVLRPIVEYGGEVTPTVEQQRRLHDRAHEECFIANSVKTEIVVELSAQPDV